LIKLDNVPKPPLSPERLGKKESISQIDLTFNNSEEHSHNYIMEDLEPAEVDGGGSEKKYNRNKRNKAN
jgi:hypothetical protein